MQLFQTQKNVLLPIQRDSFKLEQEIHSLIEQNLDSVFGLEFVTSEFAVGQFRLDTLAFDSEANAFVVIEYKKGHSYSVIDQGYSYLSVMLNNKADFILEYNEKTGKKLKRDGVAWSASRVMFVAPSFNSFQKNSVNFRDVPFDLWEIRRFENGIIALEKYESASTESIQSISKENTNSAIASVSAEVRVFDEADHVAALDASLKPIWIALREQLADHSDTDFFVSKSYVSWKRDKTAVCFIHFKKTELRIDILRGQKKPNGEYSKGFFNIDDPKHQTKERTWTWKSGQTGHVYAISVDKLEDIDYLMFLLDQKYKSLE
jgi:hypothetical protein